VYSTRSNLTLGFHGCEKSEQKKLNSDPSYIKASKESFDWLGHGMYFWENNPERALLWAHQKKN
jgi:ribulose-5-phosphate 4-epimerase/fuculose-1-phosphate aldolase